MKTGGNGYQQYFNKRRSLANGTKRAKRRIPSQIWLLGITVLLTGGTLLYWGGAFEKAMRLLDKVEVTLLGEASAEEHGAAKTADATPAKEEKSAAADAPAADGTVAPPKTWTEEEVALFKQLEARKKQLDAREQELSKLEEELQRQRGELERRLASLNEVRASIAAKLEDKVKIDQQKVESLVSVYANMKPNQAAKVIEGLNEDLAVEVLAKMKNKAAAAILNLMDAEKAKKLSERFAGYRDVAGIN